MSHNISNGWTWQEDGFRVVRTVCWGGGNGCHGGCGILLYVEDDRLIKIEGDPHNPHNRGRLCAKAFAATKIVHHPDRIRYPMKRVGQRGEGRWQRISWDEALGTIADRLNEITSLYGSKAVVFMQGTGRGESWIVRLMTSFGSPNWGPQPAHICYFPRLAAMAVTIGEGGISDAAQQFPDRYDNPQWHAPQCMLNWGKNPYVANSTASSFFGGWITDIRKKYGSRLIVVDPRLVYQAARADIWLQLRPGTDAALALGMLKVIVDEDLYDHKFIEKWSNAPFLVRTDTKRLLRENDVFEKGSIRNFVSWDTSRKTIAIWDVEMQCYDRLDVKSALTGLYEINLRDGRIECKPVWQMLIELLEDYTPDRVEEVTWVQKSKMIEAARLYAASKPAWTMWGVAIDQNVNSSQTTRAVHLLPNVTGNIDLPGGNAIIPKTFNIATSSELKFWGLDSLNREQWDEMLGVKEHPMLRIGRNAHPNYAWSAILDDKPYPVKGIILVASNPLSCTYPNPRKVLEALKKVEFFVAFDIFLTPTAQMADIVLPATAWPERMNTRAWWTPLTSQNRALLVGEAKCEVEFTLELGRRLNPRAYPFKTSEEMLDEAIKSSGMTYAEVREKGWIYPPFEYKKYEKGLLRRDGKPGFNTPSGKAEIWSSIFEEFNLAPLPSYKEPPESPVSTPYLYKDFPLILITGSRSYVYFHGEGRNVDWMRELHPFPYLQIHPETATKLGIADGDWVWIETRRGRCKQKAKVTYTVDPRVVHADYGWWYPEKPSTAPEFGGVWESNVNVCTDDTKTDPAFGSNPLRGLLCRVYKA